MKLNRKIVNKISGNKIAEEDSIQYMSKSELLFVVWEITRDVWSFIEGEDAERRLQRNVTNIVKMKSE